MNCERPCARHLSGYNNLSQYRKDTWSSLEEAADRLAVAAAANRPLNGQVDRVQELIDRLNPIERYWAFPGPQSFHAGRRLFTAGKYTRFSRAVASVSRALATDSFRNGIPWSVAAAIADQLDQPSAAPRRPSGRTSRCSSSRT